MTLLKNVDLYIHTLIRMKPVQLFYQLKYRLLRVSKLKKYRFEQMNPHLFNSTAIYSKNPFQIDPNNGFQVTYLNITETFSDSIDWPELKHGRLWNYHLQYADFLHLTNIKKSVKVNLLYSLYRNLFSGNLPPEPYPASLRSMNVIRWLNRERTAAGDPESKNRNDTTSNDLDEKIITGLSSELEFIYRRPEYHLLGNHLLENAFALLMGGHFLQHPEWMSKAEKIFNKELDRQIRRDGAHAEESVMYHTILLERFLEAYNYLPDDHPLKSRFYAICGRMGGWLRTMQFKNGDIPPFNDCIPVYKREASEVLKLMEKPEADMWPVVGENSASRSIKGSSLSDSGFRKLTNDIAELIVKTGGPSPSYLPAHSHADTFSYILYIHGKPLIVDPGISTYEPGDVRMAERTTARHNCVTIDDMNTSDIWESFRIGRRPKVQLIEESTDSLSMKLHFKPYRKPRFHHKRMITMEPNEIQVHDHMGNHEIVTGRLHLHPDRTITSQDSNRITVDNGTTLFFDNCISLELFTYPYNYDFNLQGDATGIIYRFRKESTVHIQPIDV